MSEWYWWIIFLQSFSSWFFLFTFVSWAMGGWMFELLFCCSISHISKYPAMKGANSEVIKFLNNFLILLSDNIFHLMFYFWLWLITVWHQGAWDLLRFLGHFSMAIVFFFICLGLFFRSTSDLLMIFQKISNSDCKWMKIFRSFCFPHFWALIWYYAL